MSTRRLCALQETWHSWGQQDGFVWASGLSRDDYHSLLEVCCPLACLATGPHINCAYSCLSSPSALQCAHIRQAACMPSLPLATCWLQAALEILPCPCMLQRSNFTLAPRGNGVSSYRLFEVGHRMQCCTSAESHRHFCAGRVASEQGLLSRFSQHAPLCRPCRWGQCRFTSGSTRWWVGTLLMKLEQLSREQCATSACYLLDPAVRQRVDLVSSLQVLLFSEVIDWNTIAVVTEVHQVSVSLCVVDARGNNVQQH